jgi:hypothetical protein
MKQRTVLQHGASLALAGVAALAFLSGCAQAPPPASSATPTVAGEGRVVQYANGRYELRGQGTAAAPYYWVWIPSGAVLASTPAVPTIPTAVVTAPAERVRTYTEGRYELVGDGSPQAPYYWVWVPTGAAAPPPPPLPPRRPSP